MPTSNFSFLREEFPELCILCEQAEAYVHKDPQSTGNKLRIALEELVDFMLWDSGLLPPEPDKLYLRIRVLEDNSLLPGDASQLMHSVRKSGNRASHGEATTTAESMLTLKRSFRLCKWFYETYSESLKEVHQLVFQAPVYEDKEAKIVTLEAELAELKKKLASHDAQQVADPRLPYGNYRKERAKKAAKRIEWTEEDTRELIDEQLRSVGWAADTTVLNYRTNRTLPERGRMMAIAEWPCGRRRADYALFIGLELYGLVEAKKYGTDIYADLTQAKHYAEEPTVPDALQQLATNTNAADGSPLPGPKPVLMGQWGDYHVPFIFSTNGRPYLQQLETKSGIWFLDTRQRYGISRVLVDWYSPEGLQQLYEQNIAESEQKLSDLNYDYLQLETGLNLRNYQVEAIRRFEEVLLNEPDRQRALLTMATGTGKTRTAIGLCHRLIKTDRFRRILFLVDRRVLAEQAFGNFQENRVENLNTFSEIYEVKDLTDKIPDIDTRLHFATVQSLVRRLFHGEDDEKVLPVDTYDMIIVDEAHRGYNEDGELSEAEFHFKNEQDYVSQYRRVLDYFDAFALGLTATPALHTTNIFGPAVFSYSYRQAVLAGYLIDHETPIAIQTRLNEEGITWEAGERPKAYDPETNQIEELEALEDDLHINVEGFNRLVITESFNKTVAKFLADHLDPDSQEKTLIFTVRQSHAELVAKLLKEAFVENGLSIHDDAVKVITGKTDKVRKEIKKFRNENYPNIAITVDLLTTGIDVPRICNLVFLRRVGSRILYEQMVGRATRTCDEIGKSVFHIYDAVRLYEGISDLTQMRPVVTRPNETFTQLAEELPDIPTEQAARYAGAAIAG
jgi:type I restriction enzyme R subunit